jgi:hypothetical protein
METFFQMMVDGMIVDGRGGGLVIGRSHSDGNIYMIQEISEERFSIVGNLEGGEYILNFDAYLSAKERLEEINSFKDEIEHMSSLCVTHKSRVLNTHSEPNDKLLWIDMRGQFIINKRATTKYFEEIEGINHRFSSFMNCDLNILIPKENA